MTTSRLRLELPLLFKFEVDDEVVRAGPDNPGGPTSNGSNLVGDSTVLPPLAEPAPAISDWDSGLEWNELIEDEVSSVIDGKKGVLSVAFEFVV